MLTGGGRYLRAVFHHFYRATFTQAVGAFEYQAVARDQAVEDHTALAITRANLQLADIDLALCVDHIGKAAVAAELDRSRWGHDHLFEGVGEQAHVDELVGNSA